MRRHLYGADHCGCHGPRALSLRAEIRFATTAAMLQFILTPTCGRLMADADVTRADLLGGDGQVCFSISRAPLLKLKQRYQFERRAFRRKPNKARVSREFPHFFSNGTPLALFLPLSRPS